MLGWFGLKGAPGKILAIKYARENNIPFLGICFGMQLAMLEFSKNVLNLQNPYSSELEENPKTGDQQIVGLMTEWQDKNNTQKRNKNSDLGGTMRLGSYPCNLVKDSKISKIYNAKTINERHRHRYEVNINIKDLAEKNGLLFSGLSPDNKLPEIIELTDHKFFIAVQFHPEFKTRPLNPHPLFNAFIKSVI